VHLDTRFTFLDYHRDDKGASSSPRACGSATTIEPRTPYTTSTMTLDLSPGRPLY
jgi:hypothetical protein